MRSKRVRMIDVANAANVSATTASFVLNGREASIPPETRQRVLKMAHLMNYRPHAAARALATGRTYRLGVVLNTSDSFGSGDSYITGILGGIMGAAPQQGYNLLLHTTRYNDGNALRDDILSGSEDGVLLVGRYESDALTLALLQAEFPTVCVSYHVNHPSCYSVDCDNERGGFLALQHLLNLGHRRIAFLYPGGTVSWGQERLAGAQRALAEAGGEAELLPFPWSETALPSAGWCEATVETIRAMPEPPTAMVCCDEGRARQIEERMPKFGIRVPEDMAMVCFNSTEISDRAHPPLTSVFQPLQEIGAAAVEMLVGLIEEVVPPECCQRLPVSLDVRVSCGANLAHENAKAAYPLSES